MEDIRSCLMEYIYRVDDKATVWAKRKCQLIQSKYHLGMFAQFAALVM